MAGCDKYIELISAALDGVCSSAELAELEAHLDQCPTCKALYDDLKTIHDTLTALPAETPPADLKDRIMAAIRTDNVTPLPVKKKTATPWKRWGATAAAVLLVALGAWGLDRGGVSHDSLPQSDPATVTQPDSDRMEARSILAPEVTADTEAMIEGYSTDDLNAPDGGAQTMPPIEAPLPSEVPESQHTAVRDASGEAAAPTAEETASIAGDALPAVDVTSTEEVEPTPEPTISLFPSNAPNLFKSVPNQAPALTAEEALDLLTDFLWPDGMPDGVVKRDMDDFYGYEIVPAEPPQGGEQTDTMLEYLGLTENGKYHEFWLYSFLLDDPDTGLAHSSTLNFFAVPLDGGEILVQRAEMPDSSEESLAAYEAGIDAYLDATTN